MLRPDRAVLGQYLSPCDVDDPALLVHGRAEALDDPRQAPHQPGRVQRRAVRRVLGPQHCGRREPLLGRCRVEPLLVAVPTVELGLAAGQRQRAALGEPGVDAVLVAAPPDVVDGFPQPQPEPVRRVLRRARATIRGHAVGNSAEHQPPLRPDAPQPAISRSSTTTRSVGSCRSRWWAVHSPVNPAPTMAMSASMSPGSIGRGVRSSPQSCSHIEGAAGEVIGATP